MPVPLSHGLQNTAADDVVKELRGLTQSLLAGTTANTTIALAAIRTEDTLIGALNNNAGTITDILSTMSINDCRASGTVTAASAVAADTVTVDGRVYTAVANGVTPAFGQFSVGATDAACATNLAAAINLGEQADTTSKVTASAASAVVTITARAEGTGGNAITLATSNNTRLAKSGTVLAGGTATGGVKSTGATNQIILTWFNKH
jgi:phage tail sheath gpL-like